jgi:hypothetical protein
MPVVQRKLLVRLGNIVDTNVTPDVLQRPRTFVVACQLNGPSSPA